MDNAARVAACSRIGDFLRYSGLRDVEVFILQLTLHLLQHNFLVQSPRSAQRVESVSLSLVIRSRRFSSMS